MLWRSDREVDEMSRFGFLVGYNQFDGVEVDEELCKDLIRFSGESSYKWGTMLVSSPSVSSISQFLCKFVVIISIHV